MVRAESIRFKAIRKDNGEWVESIKLYQREFDGVAFFSKTTPFEWIAVRPETIEVIKPEE